MTGEGGQEGGAMGREDFYTFEGVGGLAGEAGRVDRKEGGSREGDFTDGYDGMSGWTYFSQATPGHPASILYNILMDKKWSVNVV